MSSFTETWPTPHGSGTYDIDGDQDWTVSVNAGYGLFVTGGAAVCYGDETTTYRNFGRCETALATADHEATAIWGPYTDLSVLIRMGPCVRCDPTTLGTCYWFWWDINGGSPIFRIYKSGTALSSPVSGTINVNDTLTLRATGTSTVTLTGYKNGVQVVQATDSTSPLSGLRVGIVNEISRWATAYEGVHSFSATDVTAGTAYTLSVATLTVNVVLDAVRLTYTPAAGSGAYTFGSGATDNIACGALTKAASWSLAVRFAFTQATTTADRRLVYFSTDDYSLAQCFLQTAVGGTNRLYAGGTRGGSYITVLAPTPGSDLDTGSHVAVVTWDAAGNLSLYIDSNATPVNSTASGGNCDTTGTQSFMIGNIPPAGTPTQSADATIYEVGWWPGTVLTGAQAAALGSGGQMNVGFPLPTDYYALDGNADDLYGGHNGTVTGASGVTDGATSWFPLPGSSTAIQTMGRGSWRGTWRGTFAGSR